MSAGRSTDAAGAALRGSAQEPFERYLDDALGHLHEEVLDAPLPPEIARLAERLEDRIRNLDRRDRSA